MSEAGLARFRELVLQDLALQKELRDVLDPEAFGALVAELARERGCDVSAEDVRSALAAARREWLERWL